MIKYRPFPDISQTDDDGLLAMGGDLSLDTLVSAYSQGIFPWFNEGNPILWWSPDPRMILRPKEIRVSKSLKKSLKGKYRVSCDKSFEPILTGCALRGDGSRKEPTWITQSMHQAYRDLYDGGYAHSVEVWDQNQLVGGLYGVVLGKIFFGESMFSSERDASKVGLVFLCQHLANLDFELIDCQVYSDHLRSLGAREISRGDFMRPLLKIDINQTSHQFHERFPASYEDLNILLSP